MGTCQRLDPEPLRGLDTVQSVARHDAAVRIDQRIRDGQHRNSRFRAIQRAQNAVDDRMRQERAGRIVDHDSLRTVQFRQPGGDRLATHRTACHPFGVRNGVFQQRFVLGGDHHQHLFDRRMRRQRVVTPRDHRAARHIGELFGHGTAAARARSGGDDKGDLGHPCAA